MNKFKTIREQAFECTRQIPELGLAIYAFGNVSAFDSDKAVFAIKPSGVAYVDLSPVTVLLPGATRRKRRFTIVLY